MNFPKIHDNGSSAIRLIDGFAEAFDALGVAYAALKRTAPNPRDYPTGFEAATEQHMTRLARIDTTQKECSAIIAEIQAQTEAAREFVPESAKAITPRITLGGVDVTGAMAKLGVFDGLPKPDLNGPAYAGGADTI